MLFLLAKMVVSFILSFEQYTQCHTPDVLTPRPFSGHMAAFEHPPIVAQVGCWQCKWPYCIAMVRIVSKPDDNIRIGSKYRITSHSHHDQQGK